MDGNDNNTIKDGKLKEKRRQKSMESYEQKMANETDEEKKARLEREREAYNLKKGKRNEKRRERRKNESKEERDNRLSKKRQKRKERLLSETSESRASKLEKRREDYAVDKQKETEEKKGKRLERQRKNKSTFLSKEEPRQKVRRLTDMTERQKIAFQNETPEEREKRIAILRENARRAIQNETVEERLARNAVSRDNSRRAIENETVEHCTRRHKILCENSRCRIENETVEQKHKRLSGVCENTRLRIENETVEQKGDRLSQQRENTKKRILNEIPEQKQKRLNVLKDNSRKVIETETLHEHEDRVSTIRECRHNQLIRETVEEREERLEQARENSAMHREMNNILVAQQVDNRHDYLHNGGWENVDEPLHQQQWVINEMVKFHSGDDKYQHKQCIVCKEAWPTKQGLTQQNYMCVRCKREKKVPKTFSVENDMDPGVLPPELEGLTQVEEMLIARVCPIMRVYRKHGGQRGYKGHVLNLPQDIESFLDKLPARVENLPVLIVRRHGADNTHRDFTVRRQRVLDAILWLKAQNPYYRDIEIDQNAVDSLPENGVPQQIRFVDDDVPNENIDDENEGPPQEEQNVANELAEESVVDNGSTSFIPLRQRQRREADAIRAAVNEEDPLDWPTVEGNAVNEFRTDGLATMAFPTLFPYGKGDPTNRVRVREVSLAEGFKHLEKFAELLPNGKYRWRFASHPRFPYWALDMKQRHQLLSQANIYLTQHPGDANLTLEELKNMVNTMTCNQMVNRLQRYVSKVQGTNQYWYQRLQELLALIEQKGCPTFFFTFSAADSYWPNLQRLLQNENNATRGEKTKSVIDNPHLTDWYFKQRLDDYIKHWLNGVLDAEWYWFRFEYQARGSIHAHGCAKLKNEPNLNRLRTKAGEGWLRQRPNRVDHLDEEGDLMFEGIIAEGREAERYLIRYADWLVTTVNNDVPDGEWRFPEVHPSSIKPCDVENKDEDYQRLVNCVERHTRCSAAYCLRRRGNQPIAECRFGFPKDLVEETNLIYENTPRGEVHTEIETKRNDHRINSHNRVMLENWRANVDLQLIIDENACARYMAKYAAKGEPASKSAKEILKTCVSTLHDNDRVSSAIKKTVIQVAGDRDMAAQETAHMLLGLPLIGCTYSFVTVSLENSRRIVIGNNEDQNEEVLQKTVLAEYGDRAANSGNNPSVCDLSLVQYVSKYAVVNSRLRERSSPFVVRTFPKVSPNPGSDTFGKYCKYQLIKYKPWTGTPENAWNNAEQTDEMFVNMYKEFLNSEYALENVFDEDKKRVDYWLRGLIPEEENVEGNDDDDEHYERPNEEAEEWMLLCRLNQNYQTAGINVPIGDETDWFEDVRLVRGEFLRESTGWVYKQKQQAQEEGTYIAGDRQVARIDITTLNNKQRQAYDIVVNHANNENADPLLMIVCGTAGTGKTYLINAIKQELRGQCLITATTGIASFSIDGQTVHSAAQLPIQEYKEIQGEALQRLQLRLANKKILIIDEMSMMGQRMLSWLDKRLRSGTDQIMRQAGESVEDQEFRALLMRMRDGKVTEQDWDLLLQHSRPHVDMSQFINAIRLFFDRKSVAEYNYEKLRERGNPVAQIKAKHCGRGAAEAKADEAGGLEAVLFLCKKAEVMLTSNLWAEVGLCNGSFGIVEKFWFAEGLGPPNLPICIIVHFAGYRGPPCFEYCDKCIPIPPKVCDWIENGRHLSRQQVPLRLRYAMTIHKSQGQTLPQAVVDLGKSEKVAGCTFVATSRVRSINNIVFEPMTLERLKSIGKSKNLQSRLEEERRLTNLEQRTISMR